MSKHDVLRLSRKSNEATRKALALAKGRRKGKPKKSYPAGTLPAYAADYKKLGFPKKQADALAQLAYGQKVIRKRLEAIEAIELARVLGMVSIQGNHHLLECAKRDNKRAECTCGSTPTSAEKKTAKETDG